MNTPIIAPPASYSPDYKSAPLTPRVPSELASPKSAGPAKVVAAVATGSLPVASVDALCARWDDIAMSYRKGGDISKAVGNAFEICAEHLRAELARANVRQPEENTAGEPRGENH